MISYFYCTHNCVLNAVDCGRASTGEGGRACAAGGVGLSEAARGSGAFDEPGAARPASAPPLRLGLSFACAFGQRAGRSNRERRATRCRRSRPQHFCGRGCLFTEDAAAAAAFAYGALAAARVWAERLGSALVAPQPRAPAAGEFAADAARAAERDSG